MLAAMVEWVEKGRSPERIVATQYEGVTLFPGPGSKVVRTRPLCPWPKVAQYTGAGSTDDEASFRCE